MIKCGVDKKECVIIGDEETILNEFSIIVYGLCKAGFNEDDICKGVGQAFAKRENEEEKSKK